MPLPSSGPLSLSQIQNEFGGSNPISLTEYYRNGPLVAPGAQNAGVPTSGRVSVANFRSSSRTVVVTYQIIGAGGAGGFGLEDGGGSGNAQSGGNSLISGPSININASGGIGGSNGSIGFNDSPPRAGQESIFGPGAAAQGNGAPGINAPATSYGAGGGGGGGDAPGTYDSSGNAGQGGFAGQYLTGTIVIPYNAVLNITIGTGGVGSGGNYPGGRGANGFCSLSFDNKTINFTSSSSFTVI